MWERGNVLALILESLIFFSVVIELFSSTSADGTNDFLKFDSLFCRGCFVDFFEIFRRMDQLQPITTLSSFLLCHGHFIKNFFLGK